MLGPDLAATTQTNDQGGTMAKSSGSTALYTAVYEEPGNDITEAGTR